MASFKIEVWGEMCPIPMLKAEKKLKELAVGDTLVMETDHSCTARSMETWVKKHKQEVECREVDYGVWEIVITKVR